MAGPTAPAVDVAEVGRVSAQLSDWQTITYFMMVLLVLAVIERMYSGYLARKEREALQNTLQEERAAMAVEREKMWGVSDKFGDAAQRLGGEIGNVVTELQVNRALSARLEGVVATLEKQVAGLSARP